MADFDAGSIGATIDVDTDPFVTGLRRAKQEAQDFERGRYNASVGADADASSVERVTEQLDEAAHDRTAHVNVDVGSSSTTRLRDALGRFSSGKKGVDIPVHADTTDATRSIDNLSKHIDAAVGFYNKNSAGGLSTGEGGHGMLALIGLAASLAPALGPGIAAMGLFGAAGAAGMVAMAAAGSLYAKFAEGAFKNIQDAIKAGKQLPGIAGQAEKAFKGVSSVWASVQKAADPGIYRVMVAAFSMLQKVIPELLPLINAMSKGLVGLLKPVSNLLESGDFTSFIHLLSSDAVKDLPMIGEALSAGLNGLMGLFKALNPVIQAMLPRIVEIVGQFDRWANLKAPAFVSQVFGEVKKYGPETMKLLGDTLHGLVNLGKGLAPLTGPALHFLDALVSAIGSIKLGPLASGVGKLLSAFSPFLKVVADLVNVLLPPLETILGTIAQDFIAPLGKSLGTLLVPAFQTLGDMLNTIAPYLGQFINSIADLVNPTGVSLLVAILNGLPAVITPLIGPLTQLVLALESVVDDGIEAITPAVGPMMKALAGVAQALVPVINGLAWFLSHKSVALTILAIAGAVKATTTAMKIWEATTKGIAVISGIIEAVSFGWAGLTVAQDANTASIIANRTAMIAWRAIQLAGAAASGIAAAATTAFGVALDVALGPVGLIIAAIALLGVGIYELVKHWSTVKKAMEAVWHWVEGVFVGMWDDVKKAVDKVGGAIKGGFTAALDWVKKHWDILAIFIAPFLVIPIELAKHWSVIYAYLKKIPGWVGGVFSGAAQWLVGAGKDILTGLWGGLKSIWSNVSGWFSGLYHDITGFFDGAVNWLESAGEAIIQGLVNGLRSAVSKLNPVGIVSGVVGGIMDHIPHSPAKVGPMSGSGWTRLQTAGNAIWGAFASGLRSGAGEAVNAAQAGIAGVQKAMTGGSAAVNLGGSMSATVNANTMDVMQKANGALASALSTSQGELMDQLKSLISVTEELLASGIQMSNEERANLNHQLTELRRTISTETTREIEAARKDTTRLTESESRTTDRLIKVVRKR